MKTISKNSGCRICKSKRLTKIFRFGPQPLANAFLTKSQLTKKEPFYPLDVYFCQNCCLVQLRDIVSPKLLFKDYVYVSSTSPVFMGHFKEFAEKMTKRFHVLKKSLVIDIGSNDGILLHPFKKQGIRVLGIEPAENIAQLARSKGVETIGEFFNYDLAKKIVIRYGKAKLVTATNVFAHINNISEVAHGVSELLDEDGVFIIEAPYLVDFLDKNLFDTVYHEHLSYISLSPLVMFFQKQEMRVFDVERVTTHGGSLRLYVCKKNSLYKTSPQVKRLLDLERHHQLHRPITYRQFAKRVEENKRLLINLLKQLKKSGKQLVGYGAPAKGNTLLNYFGITTKYLNYIVDDSVFKQGLFTPGTHIPVMSPHELSHHPPDYLLILAWNFADSIIEKLAEFRQYGGKFIIPVPKPTIR